MAEKMKEPSSTRQKVTIGAVIVVIAVVLWQFKGLLGIGESTAPSSEIKPVTQSQPAKMTANAPQSMSSGPRPTTGTPSSGQTMSAPQSQPTAEVKEVSIINTGISSEEQAATQKYIGKVNELEELKIQKDIAETNQAIATAKLATVTAEKNISDLLTKPAVSTTPPPPPPSSYATQMGAPIQSIVSPPPPVSSPPPLADYTVISVTMQLHKWSAVIGYQGKLFNVDVGDVLPPDSSVVTSISRDSVVLKRNGKVRKVSVVSSI